MCIVMWNFVTCVDLCNILTRKIWDCFIIVKIPQSSLVAQWVKDLMSLQQIRLLLWCGFDPWPRNFYRPQAWPKQTNENLSCYPFIVIPINNHTHILHLHHLILSNHYFTSLWFCHFKNVVSVESYRMWPFDIWIFLLSIMLLRSIQVVVYLKSSFLLFFLEWCSITWMCTVCLTIPIEAHLSCFQCLDITNKIAVSIYVHVFVWTNWFL